MNQPTPLTDPWLVAVWPGMGNVALAAGELITLGSVVKTFYPDRGMRVDARFEGLGTASVTVGSASG